MPDSLQIVGVVLAYLLGSIPTAVWVGKIFYQTDVREHGSGNAGATNTFRVLGKKAGVFVLLFDVFKGVLAVLLASYFSGFEPGEVRFVNYQLALGVAALLGHIFPVYAGFRGGKGIATLLGIMLAVHPQAAGSCIAIFLVVFLLTRYVSLGSIVASICFPLIVILVYQSRVPSLVIFSVFIAVMVIITHQKNIERLIRRDENKANLRLIRTRSEKYSSEEDYEEPDEDDD